MAPFAIWVVVQFSTADPRLFDVRGTVGCAVTAVLSIVLAVLFSLPLAYLLFYSRRDVRLTVERLDPVTRWTQEQPLPVLGAALMYASAAVGFLASLVDPVLPVPGGILTGWGARGVLLAETVVSGALAWGLYRGKREAWIAALILTAAWFALCFLSFRDFDFQQMQKAMGASEEEQALMSRADLTPGLMAVLAVSAAVWLGCLIWLRKYFGPRSPQPQ